MYKVVMKINKLMTKFFEAATDHFRSEKSMMLKTDERLIGG